jgi:hypothetical protein
VDWVLSSRRRTLRFPRRSSAPVGSSRPPMRLRARARGEGPCSRIGPCRRRRLCRIEPSGGGSLLARPASVPSFGRVLADRVARRRAPIHAMWMRGRVLLIALSSAASGHPALPPAGLAAAPANPAPLVLAPSPYELALAPDPFASPTTPGPALPVAGARQRTAPRSAMAAALAPSPYDLDLARDAYQDPDGWQRAVAGSSARLAVGPALKPRALAPSPYERPSSGELAPVPY